MTESQQDKEFTTYGIPKILRGGIMLGFLSISLILNIYLFKAQKQSDDDKVKLQKELYEKMIDYVDPTLKKMDRAASNADSASARVDSALNDIQLNK